MTNSQNQQLINKAWDKIAPTWPLQNIIACNPLQGFENLEFEKALEMSEKYFQQQELPHQLEAINRNSIKWLQVYFDVGQATFKMPNKKDGLFKSWKKLAIFDNYLHQNNKQNKEIINNLDDDSTLAIGQILKNLKVKEKDQEQFLTLMLSSLNGWSSYVKYLGDWSNNKDDKIKTDYLAFRLGITSIFWPESASQLISYFNSLKTSKEVKKITKNISKNEKKYHQSLIKEINKNQNFKINKNHQYDAQLVFCIDVRSEPFRKSLESVGNYETFGFAGFFGIPTAITNEITGESYAACPVLLSPSHNIHEKASCSHHDHKSHISGKNIKQKSKGIYQALKYNFTSPLALAEAMGIWSGIWMFIKTFSPKLAKRISTKTNEALKQNITTNPDISAINIKDQCNYALNNLKAMGMVDNFSDIVIFCGHGSHSNNNSFASSLDCGACAGRHGDSNAKILAQILNQDEVRDHLEKNNIKVPKTTIFVGAKHNTTTDEVEIFDFDKKYQNKINLIKQDLKKAQNLNNQFRALDMGFNDEISKLPKFFFNRANSWNEVQPEWGLAKNAAFIVGPRDLTKNIDLKGRSFLHSYDYEVDEDCAILNLILNAPMVVAQWINSQYLFSTLDNTAFGSGSKISQNIVGKIGVMQGNCSDLMHGLPSQSVNINDQKNYHQLLRLTTFVYAPIDKINKVISQSRKLQELFQNNWVALFCIDPNSNKISKLNNKLKWD